MRFPDREETPGRFPPNLSLSLSLCLSLLFTACLEDTPSVRDTTIHLSVIHEGTFSVKLKVSVEDTSDVWTFSLARDDSVVNTTTTHHSQITISDGGLNPGQTYRYRAHRLIDGEIAASSAEVSAATLDTTSHNFYWTIDTLGEYGSYLNDVAIIDENNIWVVGYIKKGDSTFNTAHWDGNEWELILIDRHVDFDGVFVFSDNEIWFSDGCFVYRYYGNTFLKIWECDWEAYGPGQANVIWGSSPEDIWFVGANGSIVHYDGSGFERMESGTEVSLTDVWGVKDSEEGSTQVWATGNDLFGGNNQSPLLALTDGEWQTIYERYGDGSNTMDEEILMSPHGQTIWTHPSSSKVWLAGGFGVFTFNDRTHPTQYTEIKVYEETGYFTYPYRLRGNTPNDLFIAGTHQSLFHFNGSTWHWYAELFVDWARFKGLDVRENFIVVVGVNTAEFLTKGIVVRGTR